MQKGLLKIISTTLVCALLTASLAGCSGAADTAPEGGTTPAADDAASTAEQTDAAEADTSEAAADTAEAGNADAGGVIDPLNQSETMPVSVAVMTGFTQSDSAVEKMLEERYNLDISLVVLPGWADGMSKISLLMASDDVPNVMWWWGMEPEYTKWAQANLLVDVSGYMDKYTNIRDYYNTMDPKTLFYASDSSGAIYRIPGDVAEPSCEVTWIRKDWLDNLGLSVPTTNAELVEVMRAFTEDDPDGNGQADTYGLGGDGYDFRSFWNFLQGYDYTHYDRFVVDDAGKIMYGPAAENTRLWLKEVADLYAKGYITPNITQDTDRDEMMANGGFGVTYSWVAWNNPSAQSMRSFYDANPGSEWIYIDMPSGTNNNPQEDPATSAAWAYFGITKSAENPERIYAWWDHMSGLEAYVERRFGVEGEDYNYDADGMYDPVIAPESEENFSQNRGLDLFHNLFNRKDAGNISNLASTTALFEKSGAASRDRADRLVEWKDPNALPLWTSSRSTIEDAKNVYMWSVVAGTKNTEEDWDAFQAELNALGLQEILAEAQAVYDTQKVELESYLSSHGLQ